MTKRTTRGPLNPREQRFCQEYARDPNGRKAAISAGYAPKGAAVQAARMLKKANVKQELARLRDAIAAETGASAVRTVTQMARLAYFDIRRLYRTDGTVKLPHEWDEDIAAAVASVEVFEEFVGCGKERKLVGYVRKIRLVDKNSAIANLARHLGMFNKDSLELKDNPFRQLFEFLNARGRRDPLVNR